MTVRNSQSGGIGLRSVRVALRSSIGTPLVPAGTPAGTAYSGIPLRGALRLRVQPPDPRRVNMEGDDSVINTFVLPPTEKPTGELATSVLPMEAVALLSSTKMFGSEPVRKLGVATDQLGYEDAVMLWAVRKAIDAEEGSVYFGQQVWNMYMLLNAQLSFRPANLENGAVGEYTYSLVANDSTVDELGVAFTDTVHGYTRAPMVISTWKDFPFIDCFLGDGTTTTFSLTHGDALSTTDPVFVAVNGTMKAPTTDFTVADGDVVFTTAPASAAIVVVEYSYVP